jgi:hypothetical protein
MDNWENLAAGHMNVPVESKLDKLLRLAGDRSTQIGDVAKISENDYPLFDAASLTEAGYLLDYLQGAGLVRRYSSAGMPPLSCQITVDGWRRLEKQRIEGIPNRCFVAMSFDHSLDDAWVNGIEPALRIDCKLDPIRIDKEEHNEKICDKIIAEIKLSQFLVADFTLHRQGVYFEAGFALGLGRQVIWMCRDDELAKAHFDTRQYSYIVWTIPEDLRVKLRNRVNATIAKKS